jgi:hypothetical protein
MTAGVIYEGWCDGGPLAGQRLAWTMARYRVPILNREIDGDRPAGAVDGEYVFDEGAWRWHGAPSPAKFLQR